MTWCVTVSVLLAVLYVGMAVRQLRGLPESISAMVYLLPRSGQWVWVAWMWAVAFTTCVPLIAVLPEGLGILGFLTLACLGFCGAMPLVRGARNTAHDATGIAAGILSQVCVAVISPLWLVSWWLMIAVVTDAWFAHSRRCYDHKGVFLAEAICAVSVYGALLTILI